MKIFQISILATLLSTLTGTASAVPIISFDDDAVSQNGQLDYATNGGTLTGEGIDFVSVVGLGTPNNDGVVLDCINCVLEFETGSNSAEPGDVPQFPNSWAFNGGGSLTVLGSLYFDYGGAGEILIADGTSTMDPLLAGSFTSANVNYSGGTGGGLDLDFNGFGIDTKHEGLLAYYGITGNDFRFVDNEISAAGATVNSDNTFTATVTNADLDNYSRASYNCVTWRRSSWFGARASSPKRVI
jgi:hypothetical protein